MSGAKIASETQKLGQTFQDGVQTAPTNADGAQGGAIAGQFQRAFGARDAMDDQMRLRTQISDGQGNTPFGQLQYSDKIGRWVERKAQSAEAANFDAWFNVNFNKSNLADRQVAQSLNPDFYKQREQFMRERTEAALRLKLIQLRGPQNEDDMYMLYLVQTGRVALPADWDRIGPAGGEQFNAGLQQQRFKSRLFKLPRITSNDRREFNAPRNAARGAWGNADQAQQSLAGDAALRFPGSNAMGAGLNTSVMGDFDRYMGFRNPNP